VHIEYSYRATKILFFKNALQTHERHKYKKTRHIKYTAFVCAQKINHLIKMVFKFNFELSNCVEKRITTSAKFIPIKHIFRACLFQQSLKRKRKKNYSIFGALKIQPGPKYRSRFERTARWLFQLHLRNNARCRGHVRILMAARTAHLRVCIHNLVSYIGNYSRHTILHRARARGSFIFTPPPSPPSRE